MEVTCLSRDLRDAPGLSAQPNCTRSGLKISCNRSLQRCLQPLLTHWRVLSWNKNKKQPTTKEELWNNQEDAWINIHEDNLPILTFKLFRIAQNLLPYILHSHLCPFPMFLAIYKEVRGGSRLLHSTVSETTFDGNFGTGTITRTCFLPNCFSHSVLLTGLL